MEKTKAAGKALCRKCGQMMPVSEFYKNDLHFGGTSGRCKPCARARVRENRKEKLDQYVAYEAERARLLHRVEARKNYIRTEKGREAQSRATKEYRKKYPERERAYRAVRYAVIRGELERPQSCPACGCGDRVIHAHHENYDEPLNVVWLCDLCHTALHKDPAAMKALFRSRNMDPADWLR